MAAGAAWGAEMATASNGQFQASYTKARLALKAGQHQQGNRLFPLGSTANPNWPKGYSVPSGMAFGNKSWSRREEGGTFVAMAFVFHLLSHMHAEAQLSGKHLDTCVLIGSCESVPFPILLGHTAFAFLIELPLPTPTTLLTILQSSLHFVGAESECSTRWRLDCSPGSVHSEGTSVLLPSDDQAAQVSADCLVLNT